MWTSLSKLAALPPATRVYCGHEYTLANLRFAQAVEPDNADVRARIARERDKRERDVPTLPSTIGDELATNPFLRARIARRDGGAAAHARRPMASDRRRRSRRCGSGRTTSVDARSRTFGLTVAATRPTIAQAFAASSSSRFATECTIDDP